MRLVCASDEENHENFGSEIDRRHVRNISSVLNKKCNLFVSFFLLRHVIPHRVAQSNKHFNRWNETDANQLNKFSNQ